MSEGEREKLRDQMIQRLIRMKALDSQRLAGALLIAVDATGQLSFGGRRHCQHCLSKKSGDGVICYHPVLEAKLVTPGGLAFSLDTEFIQNPDPNPSKQAGILANQFHVAHSLLLRCIITHLRE